MHWPVLNTDFVLAVLEVIKVGYSVLHPVLIITLGEVLASMCASALLHNRVSSQHMHSSESHTSVCRCTADNAMGQLAQRAPSQQMASVQSNLCVLLCAASKTQALTHAGDWKQWSTRTYPGDMHSKATRSKQQALQLHLQV